MWMTAGLIVIILGVAAVGVISNKGRISSDTGNDITQAGFQVQRRAACITDLSQEANLHRGQVLAAVLNRLAVLDGYNPASGKKLPQVVNAAGQMVANPDLQKTLAQIYVQQGIKARNESKLAQLKLVQPTLNKLCGEPIVNQGDIN